MKKGIVNSGILTYAGSTASDKAQTGLALAQTASQAEQQRYQNSVNDLAVVASDAGVEEGFARIFRTLNAGLSESNGLVRILSEGFNDATKWADDLLLWPQSFVRALEGRDSLVADWLGEENVKKLRSDWSDVKELFSQIGKISESIPPFMPSLKSTTEELRQIVGLLADFNKWQMQIRNAAEDPTVEVSFWSNPIMATTQQAGIFARNVMGAGDADTYDFLSNPLSRSWQILNKGSNQVYGVGENFWNVLSANLNDPNRGKMVYGDPNSPYYHDPVGYDDQQKMLRNAPLEDRQTFNPRYGINGLSPREAAFGIYNEPIPNGGQSQKFSHDNIQTPDDIASQSREAAMAQAEASITNNNITNQFDVSINVDATLAGIEVEAQANAMAQAFSTSLTGAFEQAQVNFPTKG